MRKDLEIWAMTFVEHHDWRERSTWFNVRIGDLDRQERSLREAAHSVIEAHGPYTLADALGTIKNMHETLDAIGDRLEAIVEMRERLGKVSGRADGR
jgi:hypothetical protein